MFDDVLRAKVHDLWEAVAGGSARFTPGTATIVASAESRLCPPGWVGLVTIDGATLGTAPDEATADLMRERLTGLPIDAMTNPDAIREALPVAQVLGPAKLAYLDASEFRPVHNEYIVDRSTPDEALPNLAETTDTHDVDEADLDAPHSPLFVVRHEGRVIAASGYRIWLDRAAHIGVVTTPEWRGRGLAKTVGAAASTHALAAGLLPQWRARLPASRAAAWAIGFHELGSQLSVRLSDDVHNPMD